MQFTVPQLWRLNSIISTKCSLWVLRWTGKMAQINPCHGLHSIGAMSIGGWWRMKPFRHRIHIQRLCSWTIQCLLSLFIFLFVRDIAKYSIYNYIYIYVLLLLLLLCWQEPISHGHSCFSWQTSVPIMPRDLKFISDVGDDWKRWLSKAQEWCNFREKLDLLKVAQVLSQGAFAASGQHWGWGWG